LFKQHVNRELGVFVKFVEISSLDIDLGSVRKLDPPSPDIFCRTTSSEALAFELTELFDNNCAHGMSRHFEGKKLLEKLYDNLPSDKRKQFYALYHDADLQFGFNPKTTHNILKQTIPLAFDELLNQPQHLQDEITIFNNQKLCTVLRFIRVNRGVQGPLFDVESYIRIGDPTVERLRGKFEKKYESSCPIELLAYIDGNLKFPDNVWKPDVVQFLERCSGYGQFRKIWIVDVYAKIVHFAVMAS
jgi:hypothetical protein